VRVIEATTILLSSTLCVAACATRVPAIAGGIVGSNDGRSDTFFAGCAYLDQDGNSQFGPGEHLLGGLSFSFTLAGGAGFGGDSAEGQCAFITVPASLPGEAWPVTVRIRVPEGYDFKLVGPAEIELLRPDTKAEFRFTAE